MTLFSETVLEDAKAAAYWRCVNYMSRAARIAADWNDGTPIRDRDFTNLAKAIEENVAIALEALKDAS